MLLYEVNILFITMLLVKCNKSATNNTQRIPIGLYHYFEDNNKEKNIVRNLFFNLLYLNLSIGTPPQIMPFHLDVNSPTFYVSKKFFNRTASSTYEQTSKNETFYFLENAISGFNSKDILNLNGDKKKINFIFETKNNKDNDIGSIGLLIPIKFKHDIYPFSASLIKAGFINSSIWTFKFYDNIDVLNLLYNKDENNIIGEFIIGDYPHNYEEDKIIYNKTKYVQFKALWLEKEINWDINFDSIFLHFKEKQPELKDNKLYIHMENTAEFNPDVGFIVGPVNFYHFINIYFFSKYRSNCRQYRVTNTLFRVVECKNTELFNVSSFPDIFFEVKDVTLNLTYKDIFILDKKLNKYIFLILYEGYTPNWVFGRLFFKKYQFVFNEHSKTIGYYNTIKDKRKYNIKDKLIVYCVSFLQTIFITLIILYLIYEIWTKCNPNKRKKRINEIDNEDMKNHILLK